MTTSNLVAYVTPPVALFFLFGWLLLVFHADSHPGWNRHDTTPERERERAIPAAGTDRHLADAGTAGSGAADAGTGNAGTGAGAGDLVSHAGDGPDDRGIS